LLVHGALGHAWRFCGLEGTPRIVGPDLEAIAEAEGHELRHAVITLAGGIEMQRVSLACVSLRRVANPTTGVGPDADEGFAVEVGAIARAIVEGESDPVDPKYSEIHHEWKSVERYMAAPGAIRRGAKVSRKSIVEYFAHYGGGVHLDRAKHDPKTAEVYALHEELDGRADIAGVDGLHAELLAMGQAIGRSPDMLKLAAIIRQQAEENAVPFAGVGLGINLS
jgi:hypothetical protein